VVKVAGSSVNLPGETVERVLWQRRRRRPSWLIGDGLFCFCGRDFFVHKREEDGGARRRRRRSVQIQKACLLLREAPIF
jgi:hypothetical protein